LEQFYIELKINSYFDTLLNNLYKINALALLNIFYCLDTNATGLDTYVIVKIYDSTYNFNENIVRVVLTRLNHYQ
jgi:hypothetical protein